MKRPHGPAVLISGLCVTFALCCGNGGQQFAFGADATKSTERLRSGPFYAGTVKAMGPMAHGRLKAGAA
jgi:hypothetical protein